MLVLDNTDEQLCILVYEDYVTATVTATASYLDVSSPTSFTEGGGEAQILNKLTYYALVGAPGSGYRRVINAITAFNLDTIPHKVHICKRIASTYNYVLLEKVLPSGGGAVYTSGSGWQFIDSGDMYPLCHYVLATTLREFANDRNNWTDHPDLQISFTSSRNEKVFCWAGGGGRQYNDGNASCFKLLFDSTRKCEVYAHNHANGWRDAFNVTLFGYEANMSAGSHLIKVQVAKIYSSGNFLWFPYGGTEETAYMFVMRLPA
jgi:hypothetical protein